MLRIDDLRDSTRDSGFKYVQQMKPEKGGHGGKPFRARKGDGGGPGQRVEKRWIGPRRSTPEEAAQDYCLHANGGVIQHTPPLKNGGHKPRTPRNPDTMDDALVAARKLMREAAAASRGDQGYIYCIGEVPPSKTYLGNLGTLGVKVGFSVEPEARVGELQTGNPRPLKLIGKIKGTLDDERALHAKYIDLNLIGEWFRPTDALLSEFKG